MNSVKYKGLLVDRVKRCGCLIVWAEEQGYVLDYAVNSIFCGNKKSY
jgi:hypothetical protein